LKINDIANCTHLKEILLYDIILVKEITLSIAFAIFIHIIHCAKYIKGGNTSDKRGIP